jgi:CRP/FNR family cyclic AMP-dependent transcriptional regulator
MRPTKLMYLLGTTFRWLLDTSFEFNHIILAKLNARLSHFMALREVERLTDPVTRVAQAIGVMYNPLLYPLIGAHLPLSQSELGEFVGLSRQSVSVALKRLEGEVLISIAYGGI